MRRFDAKSDRFGDGDARILRSPARRGRPHGELNPPWNQQESLKASIRAPRIVVEAATVTL